MSHSLPPTCPSELRGRHRQRALCNALAPLVGVGRLSQDVLRQIFRDETFTGIKYPCLPDQWNDPLESVQPVAVLQRPGGSLIVTRRDPIPPSRETTTKGRVPPMPTPSIFATVSERDWDPEHLGSVCYAPRECETESYLLPLPPFDPTFRLSDHDTPPALHEIERLVQNLLHPIRPLTKAERQAEVNAFLWPYFEMYRYKVAERWSEHPERLESYLKRRRDSSKEEEDARQKRPRKN